MMKRFILCFLLLQHGVLIAQDAVLTPKKNAVKGMVWFLPLPFSSVTHIGASLGYERNLSAHIALELYVNHANYSTWFSDYDRRSNNIRLSYKYLFFSKRASLNNTWLGMYARYESFNTSEEFEESKGEGYGWGFTAGKRIYFSKKKRMFFDLGVAAGPAQINTNVYYHRNYYTNISLPDYSYSSVVWNKRLILLLGYSF